MNVDLYPKSRSKQPDWELFRNPTSEYRGTPFWSWNNKLDKDQLLRQIDQLAEMGFGGFHMHPRTGLDTPYLSDEFMGMVRACADKAKEKSMLAWLYDEDRWPSGFAGGLVTKDPQYRARHLLFTCEPYGTGAAEATNISKSSGARTENGTLLAKYEVVLEDGALKSYRLLADGEEPTAGRAWYAYVETATPVSWYNNQTYVNTLSKDAIQRFVEVTHERYLETVGDQFGASVPAIFTDEPQFTHKQSFARAEDTSDLFMPWTEDLTETYAAAYGERLEGRLPEVFWELPEGQASAARYRYHDHVCERFAQAFADTIGDWCDVHGIALTGHMMQEPTLQSQTAALGEAMRSYRAFHIPGIDMLCDRPEYTTAKQAQSAAHQYGRGGILSELYGVTNWDYDFIGHKGQGDWQAALGVTVRVPHLWWVSMAGEAKRDYPAAIGYQSPWYREYPLVEDHFARVAAMLTRGKPAVRVAVVHPVESYWLSFGPQEQTRLEREEREAAFENVTEWLLFGLVDFDYVSESLLPKQSPTATPPSPPLERGGARFSVGEMAYEAVIVPAMRTIRSTTLDRLEAFADAGGDVIFAGEVPSLVDALPSDRAQKLAERCRRIELTRTQLLKAVAPYRDIEVRLATGGIADKLLSQLRIDGENRILFLVNTDRKHGRPGARLLVNGDWKLTRLNTFTGEREELAAEYRNGKTILTWDVPAHGHILLFLAPGRRETGALATQRKWTEAARLDGPAPVTLSEPNVLLLDQPAWRIGGGAWQEPEETLRLTNTVRKHFGLAPVSGNIAQPWTDPEPPEVLGTVELKFTVSTDVPVQKPVLALENAAETCILWDGSPVASAVTGWWVDEAIHTVALPSFEPGTHELILQVPFTRKTSLEWSYLLGDFGVDVRGRSAKLIAPVRELAFGDWTRQGLPFYAGNVTYHLTLEADGAETAVRGEHFKAPLLSVDLDGKPAGKIAFDPFRVELGAPSPGAHRLDITAFGNRVNAFGDLHNANEEWPWGGPNAWRTEGGHWSYEYQLTPMGVLVAPVVEVSAG